MQCPTGIRMGSMLAVLLAVGACASADVSRSETGERRPVERTAAASAVAYPTPLHGLWVAEGTQCPPQGGAYEGDLFMEISAERIAGYEDVRRPVSITPLTTRPNAWRIESHIDIGPSGRFEPDEPELFTLEGGILTVAQEARVERFRPCPDR